MAVIWMVIVWVRRRRAERLRAQVAVLAAEAEVVAAQRAAAAARLRRLRWECGALLEQWLCLHSVARTTRRLGSVVAEAERIRCEADTLIDELRRCGYRELADGCWLTPAGTVLERSRTAGARTRGHNGAT